MNKKRKQDMTTILVIGLVCALILWIFSFMMPSFPTYEKNESLNVFENKPIVVLDPGHGGYDDGCFSVDGQLEKTINLEIALKVKTILEENGVEVIMTRSSDEVTWSNDNVDDLQARLDIATQAKAAVMVSLHCNSSDEEAELTRGSEVYANSSQADSLALAASIEGQLKSLEPDLPSRGVKSEKLHLLTFNTLPTVIVEMGFLSNTQDTLYLNDSVHQDQLANACAKGILDIVKP